MPFNIAFYSDALTSGRYGLGRHAWELFRGLRRLGGVNVRPVCAHATLPPDELAALERDPGLVRLPWSRKVTAGLWTAFGAPRLEHWTPWADLVHCVELDYRVPTRRPLVVSIHDLGPISHPEYFGASHPWLLRHALRHALNRAAAILCISKATADAVEDFAKRSLGSRLSVLPIGVSEEFFEPVAPEGCRQTDAFLQTGAPFFLWAGSLNPRKNLPRVVAAFEAVAAEIPHHLVLVGGMGWDSDETLRRVQRSPVAARIHLPGRVSDEELRGLYQRATGFVFASLMEGFGLPILEAMASNCPVITSNLSSMPEVAGHAALLVDPRDPSSIAGAMKRLAGDPELARTLRERGRHRASIFRWEHYARSVLRVYHQVAERGVPAPENPPPSQAQAHNAGSALAPAELQPASR